MYFKKTIKPIIHTRKIYYFVTASAVESYRLIY